MQTSDVRLQAVTDPREPGAELTVYNPDRIEGEWIEAEFPTACARHLSWAQDRLDPVEDVSPTACAICTRHAENGIVCDRCQAELHDESEVLGGTTNERK